MLRHVAWAPALILLLINTAAQGQSTLSPSPKVQPSVLRTLHTGVLSPHSTRFGIHPGLAPVFIVLRSQASPETLDRLRTAGARLQTVGGLPLSYGRFVPARVTAKTLGLLSQLSDVTRVLLAPARGPLPLDLSAKLVGLQAARGARPALDYATGQGVVVADIDTNADVFHPQFFRADGGYFDWIDVNRNRVLDPGVDGIDLDRDGKVGVNETTALLKAQTVSTFYGDPVAARGFDFDPSIDWVYLDENHNNKRDYGSLDGFNDQTPALGEPLFVPDDINGNQQIDVGERVIRLASSKFKKVYVHIEDYADVDHVFERGVDLSKHQNNFTTGAYGYDEALHATAVLSILAGDVPLVGRRWVGMAPDVDILLGYDLSASDSNAITWAMAQSPDVVLHESAAWTGTPLDGTDSLSMLVDESTANSNITHTCPVGNTGGARKHAHYEVAAGQSTEAEFNVPLYADGAKINYVQASLNIRGASSLGVVLRDPGGKQYDVGATGSGVLANGALYYSTHETTTRGTFFFDLIIYGSETSAAPEVGYWTIALSGAGQPTATVDAYLMDDVSSWSLGAAWDPEIATDTSTIGIPAVSDHCIAVGSHTGHPATDSEDWFNGAEKAGEVRGYSGRGPRIDGVQKPDILAPDNPWSAAPHIQGAAAGNTPYAAVWPFGGTSGAAPHVAGVAALLAQGGIRGDQAREAIRSGAIRDSVTGNAPNGVYGWGRLSAAGAFQVGSDGLPPTVTLAANPSSALVSQSVELLPTVSDPDSQASTIQIRWDDGYDGTWDTEYGPIRPRTITKTVPGAQPFRVRARDERGRIAEAIVWVGTEAVDASTDAPIDASPDAKDARSEASANEQSSRDSAAESGVPESGILPFASPADDDSGCGCTMPGIPPRAPWLTGICLLAVRVVRRRSRLRG